MTLIHTQRFLRGGYAHTTCLLGVTGMRERERERETERERDRQRERERERVERRLGGRR